MSVRLNKVAREVNVGVASLVEFLQKNGIVVENDPNVKVSDDAYELLWNEFGEGEMPQRAEKSAVSTATTEEKPVPPSQEDKPKVEEIKTEIPEEEKVHIKSVGKIDLDSVKKKVVEEEPETTKISDASNVSTVSEEEIHQEVATEKEDISEKKVPEKIVSEKHSEAPVKKDENLVSKEIPSEKIEKTVQEVLSEKPVDLTQKESVSKTIENTVEQVSKEETTKASVKTDSKEEASQVDASQQQSSTLSSSESSESSSASSISEEKGSKSIKTTISTEKAPIVDEKEETPVKENPIEDSIDKTVESNEPEIFTFGERRIQNNIKVVSTIDLNAINQFTRPKKKTKQEKLKEQEERRQREAAEKAARKASDESRQRPISSDASDKTASDKSFIKKKRNRINDGKIRIDGSNESSTTSTSTSYTDRSDRPKNHSESLDRNNNNNNSRGDKKGHFKKTPLKVEINEEDVSKQIKETLAHLTAKPKKGAKYRKEKRDAVSQRLQEREEMEALESNTIKITEFVTVNDLANMMNVPAVQVISKCMEMGQMVSINQRLDAETINIVADEFGFKTEYVSADVMQAIHEEEDSEEDLVPRPPIITVMGHVDHGKTSLLDYIRKANVIAGEAGGITQHIGAYSVTLEDGREITFLDTPGHEAFTAMRARGAQVTDIAIIIVAADDNVMPQTIEAINHASIAGVPIVFAINKVDKPTADPERIKKELAEMNYLVEDWGGKYQSQDISAKKGLNVKELLEKVLLEAEMLNLKANPKKRAVGSIIESSLDKGRGYVATVLVKNGTLKMGDIVVAGTNYGRIKAMFNERGQKMESAGPGEPALILGLNGAPQAGDNFNVLESEQEAREISNKRERLQREQGLRTGKILTLAEIGRRIAVGNFRELNLIVKGDVDGSVEALSDSLIKLSTERIQVNVIHKAVGQISESDVTLASASDAIIVGFQVRPSLLARRLAEHDGVDIRLYSIIYDAIEEVKSAMEGLLSPEIKEEILGSAEIREVFKISKVGAVAGCMVKDGKIKRGSKVRLIRDGIVVFTGELDSLKRFKDDAKEVLTGFECGMSILNYNDLKVGDYIEAYEEHEVKQTL